MRIGELALRAGVSERSLRYYEQQGLLTAERANGGHRQFPDSAVARVIRIQELFAAGLHSTKIAAACPACAMLMVARSRSPTSSGPARS